MGRPDRRTATLWQDLKIASTWAIPPLASAHALIPKAPADSAVGVPITGNNPSHRKQPSGRASKREIELAVADKPRVRSCIN